MPSLFDAMPHASRLAVAASTALAAFGPTTAFADASFDSATTLDAVEVRSQRPPLATVESLRQAQQRLDERAGATGLVDGESYRDGRASTLTDALGHATGVFVQSRFGAEEARLSIRGSGLQRTFHGRGIVLLQDGSPLNLADGAFDFQAVEPLAARQIEVYRGANALEYGASTLGGALNFISPTGYDAAPLGLRVESGSFGYLRSQATLAGFSDRADGYLSLTGLRQDGYRDHSQQENYRLFGNAGWRFSDALDARVYLTHVDTRSELPGNLTLAQSRDNPRAAAPASVALDQRRDFRLDRIAGKLGWSPGDGRTLTLSAFYSGKSLHHPIYQVLEQESHDAGLDLRWRNEGELGGRRNVLVAGMAYTQGDIDDDRFINAAGHAGARTNRFDQHATNASAYVENQTWLDARWVLSLGAQGLSSTRRSRDGFITAGRDESYDVDYAGFSPKVGVRYLIDAHGEWFANLSRSLEPPSFGELSGGPNVTQVDKQHADSGEVGFRVRRDALTIDAALYRARLRGELLSLSDAQGNPLGTVNAGRTLHQGLELGADWHLGQAWTLSGNYLWNDFRFDRDPVYGDNALAGVPPQQMRMTVRWSPGDGLYIAPNVEWVPQDYYVDHANSFRAPGYAVTGLRIGGHVGAQWSWFVDARNLGDRRWIASTNVVADAHGMDQANFLPGDGRAFYAGIEWRMP
ncbi:TonB-dependent receptor family protein [Lysobacter niastensis]|uniref:TonB-dependent receptor n=1 Tax=Lysobacter niastensis TaxID=380629 RepID=A0ABS0B4H1_9GAMM|nr:TonB-dependent receptor [Lysobacter niastensis]MBF6023531.1 TonB-dependent receptor [Lysobacter niastensis]